MSNLELTTWADLSPQERDRLVAENVMGYTVHEVVYETERTAFWEPGPRYSLFDAQGELAKGYKTGKYSRPEYVWHDCPPYTQSLDAAWSVIAYIYKVEHSENEAQFLAKMQRRTAFMRWFGQAHLWSLSAREAAEVICFEALRLFGFEVEA